MPAPEPPSSVLRAFGVGAALRALPGGQGTAWRAGDLVLKPGDGQLQSWLAGALEHVSTDEVRVAAPVSTSSGAWTYEGWCATQWLEGAEPDRSASVWVEVVEAGRALHRAFARLERPGWLDARTDAWARADRAAWGESDLRLLPSLAATARRLQPVLTHLGPPQVVHADLTHNVLFLPDGPPAVIDISPYWRPTAFAEGVVVADAMCWYDAPASLLAQAQVSVAAVARALLFRLATTSERVLPGDVGADVDDEARRYARAAEALEL